MKNQVEFDMAGICTLCIDPTKVSDYFDADGKLIIEEAALTTFVNSVKTVIDDYASKFDKTSVLVSAIYEDLKDADTD